MRFIVPVVCLLLSIQVFAQEELSENVEVYRGEGNLTVTLVRVLPLDTNQALLSVSGIDHELSGLVFNYDLSINNGNRRLTTDIYGRRYNSFVETSSWGSKRQTLYIPGEREGFHLYFDSEASKSAKPSSLLKRHKEQKASGKLTAVQRFNREKEETEINKAITKETDNLLKACGKPIKVVVDWSTITDDIIKSHSVNGYCGEAASTVAAFCRDEARKAWVAKSIDIISCKFSDSINLKLQNKNLQFRTAVDEANQRSFVKENLRNFLSN